MPNWSFNRITLRENAELDRDGFYENENGKHDIRKIFDEFLEDIKIEGGYDLGKVNPTPDILTKVRESNPRYLIKDRKTGEYLQDNLFHLEGDEYSAFFDTNTHPDFEKVVIEEGGDIYNELLEKYGALGWYDWNVRNWGTKWNPTFGGQINMDDYELIFTVDTAWAPPHVLLQTIADKYKVDVECFYEIEGYGDEGVGKDFYEPLLDNTVEV